jgi:hypothetical protein
VYRNESLVQMEAYQTDPERADRLVEKLRSKWALLREKEYAADYPVEILRGDGAPVKVVELYRWTSPERRAAVLQDSEVQLLQKEVEALTLNGDGKESFTEVLRGFNSNFPVKGGVELLKGVCSCQLTIDGLVKDYSMSVKNGIVLMHRSPRMDLDGDGKNEMYLKILMHGGEPAKAAFGPMRVEQNFTRPNDGIVKSNGVGDRDFPATAIWRVAWRIQTPLGAVLTDPDQPLIFGPATVSHYPPVGTNFYSATGPVALVLEASGRRVGTLTPRELTAFDVVVTKDDEIPADILNSAPTEVFDVLDHYAAAKGVPGYQPRAAKAASS